MNLSKTLLALSVAIGGALASAPPALASQGYNAVSSVALNVRSGPGTRFTIVDTLYKGEPVQTQECRLGWCFVSRPGPDGWVSARYLRSVAAPPPSYTPPPAPPSPPAFPWPSQPAPTHSFDPWPGPSIPWPFQPWPGNPRPPHSPQPNPFPTQPEYQACLFDGKHFTGRSVCVTSGNSYEQLGPRWNNRFSSVRIDRGVSVTLCRNKYFTGFCRTFSNNVPDIGPMLNNAISSLRVD